MKTVKDYIRTIPDFPHEGIMFRDVTTLFADPRGLRLAIDQLLHPYAGVQVDKISALRPAVSFLAVRLPTNWEKVLSQSASRASCPARPCHRPIHWNMAKR